MAALQGADRFCSDEFIALAMDEELQKRDAPVMQPATGSQRELLKKPRNLVFAYVG